MRRSDDFHGNAPESSALAVLLVDVVNDFDFPGGDRLLEQAVPAARRLSQLCERARERGVPVIYANDNWGRWRSDFRQVVRHVLREGSKGEPIARLLRPRRQDYFVLKPKHSAFYATTLDTLLEHLGAQTLVLGGFAGDICVLFTAKDAFLREYRVVIPSDCVASVDPADNQAALRYARRVLDADTRPSTELELSAPRYR